MSEESSSDLDAPLTITIARRVRPGCEEPFERLMHDFVPRALTFSGHLGVHVTKLISEAILEYHVVIKFASRKQWREFHAWPEYEAFRAAIDPLLETEPSVAELSGLESWFTPVSSPLRSLPRWKMALITLLGVYPISLGLNLAFGPTLDTLPPWLRSLFVSSSMVVLLTWVVMPNLQQIFSRWLQDDAPPSQPR
jgi:antibiotic biosynthesis monooxygenase (ABM) superfamily enzyme